MMVVNGAGSRGVTAWEETIATGSGTYAFSFWGTTVVSAGDSNPASLVDILVNDSSVIGGPFDIHQFGWTKYTTQFSHAGSGPLTIKIVKNETAPDSNDFALDDISLSAVPEPASLTMWSGVCLIGLIASRLRIRRRLDA